jgi:hypothetical protein
MVVTVCAGDYILCAVSPTVVCVVSAGAVTVVLVSLVTVVFSVVFSTLVVSAAPCSSVPALLHAAKEIIAHTERRANTFFIAWIGIIVFVSGGKYMPLRNTEYQRANFF